MKKGSGRSALILVSTTQCDIYFSHGRLVKPRGTSCYSWLLHSEVKKWGDVSSCTVFYTSTSRVRAADAPNLLANTVTGKTACLGYSAQITMGGRGLLLEEQLAILPTKISSLQLGEKKYMRGIKTRWEYPGKKHTAYSHFSSITPTVVVLPHNLCHNHRPQALLHACAVAWCWPLPKLQSHHCVHWRAKAHLIAVGVGPSKPLPEFSNSCCPRVKSWGPSPLGRTRCTSGHPGVVPGCLRFVWCVRSRETLALFWRKYPDRLMQPDPGAVYPGQSWWPLSSPEVLRVQGRPPQAFGCGSLPLIFFTKLVETLRATWTEMLS